MKRLFPIMCTLLLLYCPFGFAAIVWDGTSKEPWTKGSGTESDPYLIETPANLAYLAEQVQNGQTYEKTYFMQTNDIDLNNKGCQVGSSSSRYFEGIYDGGQKQIINVVYYLFGYIKSATIQNLTIAGASTYPMINNANGNVTLVNCHNKSTSKISQGGAGLVNVAEQGCITLENCSNSAAIMETYKIYRSTESYLYNLRPYDGYIGGLVAKADTIKVNHCSNIGTLSAYKQRANELCVAGLVGKANSGYISNSFNTADICVTGAENQGSGYRPIGSLYVTGLCYTCPVEKLIVNQSYVKWIQKNVTWYTYLNMFGISSGTNTYCYSIGEGIGCYNDISTNCYCILSKAEEKCVAGYPSVDIFYNSDVKIENPYNAIAKTKDQMKSPSFVSLLNGEADYFYPDYTNINDGYPILRWQLEGTTMYKIRATCPSAQGVVSGSGEYPATANITLKAMPKDGYAFTGWSDGNTDNPRTITVNGNATYVAQFSQSAYTIYVNQDCTTDIE